MVASESLRNDFAQQMLPTTKQHPPQINFEKKSLIAKRMMRWERGWQIKSSCIHLISFHFYSFATAMINMLPNTSLVMFY